MPAFWSQLSVDYTNAREDVRGEADSYAFTDALLLGYALRWVESERADGRCVPDDIALRLEDPGQDRQRRALEIVVEMAGSRLSEIRTLTGEAWDRFDYWAWQFVAKRSRTRRGSLVRDWVDYGDGAGLAFGYALRCCVEVSGPPAASDTATAPADTNDSSPVGVCLKPDGTVLDLGEWISDSTVVCANEFEPFAEHSLELSIVELFGIQRVVDFYLKGRKYAGDNPSVEAAVSNARLGYAIRNRETQLIDCYGHVRDGDPLAALALQRAETAGIRAAVAHRLVRDVLDYQDPRNKLYESTPGTSGKARLTVFQKWAHDHFPGDDPQNGRMATIAAMEHGYFLHRLFEIQPNFLR